MRNKISQFDEKRHRGQLQKSLGMCLCMFMFTQTTCSIFRLSLWSILRILWHSCEKVNKGNICSVAHLDFFEETGKCKSELVNQSNVCGSSDWLWLLWESSSVQLGGWLAHLARLWLSERSPHPCSHFSNGHWTMSIQHHHHQSSSISIIITRPWPDFGQVNFGLCLDKQTDTLLLIIYYV